MTPIEEIQVGDWVEFPKGTQFFPTYNVPDYALKKQKVMVREIVSDPQKALRLLSNEYQRRMATFAAETRYRATLEPGTRWNYDVLSPMMDEEFSKVSEEILATYPGKRPILVEWGQGRYVLADDALKIAEPEVKKKAPTKSQQMVPKSVWRFTETVDVTIPVENSKWNKEHYTAHRKFYDYGANKLDEDAYEAYMSATGLTRTLEVPSARIEVGAELAIAGKRSTYFHIGHDFYNGSSYLFPFKIPATGVLSHLKTRDNTVWLPYDRIAHLIEPVEVPVVKTFVLRNRDTGEFFKEAQGRYAPSGQRPEDGSLIMVKTFSQARKFKDMSVLKLSVCDWTGYYQGLPESMGEGRPYWAASGGRVCDLPSNFEVVAFDKLAKTEIETIDIQEWYARLWKLRTLTINYGSVVRRIYNELDKKGLLKEFQYALTIRQGEDAPYPYTLTDEDKEAFESMVAMTGAKKADIRRAKDDYSMAVAFRNPDDAFAMRLFYSGKLKLSILNLDTLEEEVRAQGA